jgi:hypothetical protein
MTLQKYNFEEYIDDIPSNRRPEMREKDYFCNKN